jgi:hypothetical protein
LDYGTGHVKKEADAGDDQDDGVNLAGAADLMNFTITNGGQRNDRHVKGIQGLPLLDNDITQCTAEHEKDGQQDGYDNMFCGFHARSSVSIDVAFSVRLKPDIYQL